MGGERAQVCAVGWGKRELTGVSFEIIDYLPEVAGTDIDCVGWGVIGEGFHLVFGLCHLTFFPASWLHYKNSFPITSMFKM